MSNLNHILGTTSLGDFLTGWKATGINRGAMGSLDSTSEKLANTDLSPSQGREKIGVLQSKISHNCFHACPSLGQANTPALFI